MSEQAKPPKKRLKVEPEAGGQLEQFLIANHAAHGKATEFNEAEADTKAQIKGYLLSLYAGREEELPDAFDIAGDPHGRYDAMTMSLKSGWRMNMDKFKAEKPEDYVAYAEQTKPTWELRRNTGGGRRR